MQVRHVKKLSSVYTFHEKIGEGRYGKVKRATNVLTKKTCACKIVRRESDYLREIDHLIHLQNSGCKFVLPVSCVTFTSSKMCLEFDLAQHSLHKFIKKRQRGSVQVLKEVLSEAISIVTQLLIAVNDMHQKQIIHRDMKPGNIVLFNDTTPWVIDYGMSKRVFSDANLSDVAKYDLVTCYYRAPEMWKKDYKHVLDEDISGSNLEKELLDIKDTDLQYDSKIDEWSIGCILFEIITGCSAFPGNDEHEIRKYLAGHVYKLTGQKCKFIYAGKVEEYDIERELNRLICMKYGEPKGNTGKYTIKLEDNDTVVMYKAVKIFLKRLLQPEPFNRASADELLNCIGYLKEPTLTKPLIANADTEKWNDKRMMDVMSTLNSLVHVCSFLRVSPKIAYFATYLFLNAYSKAPEQMKQKYTTDIIMFACFKITASYHTDCYSKVSEIEAILPQKFDWKELHQCILDILCVTRGQVWIENPGDRRREIYPFNDVEKWNDKIEKQIFDAILLLVLADSGPPDVELVFELVKFRKENEENEQ